MAEWGHLYGPTDGSRGSACGAGGPPAVATDGPGRPIIGGGGGGGKCDSTRVLVTRLITGWRSHAFCICCVWAVLHVGMNFGAEIKTFSLTNTA